jgi:hypothetical protein
LPRFATICHDLPQFATICHDLPQFATICHDLPRFATICFGQLLTQVKFDFVCKNESKYSGPLNVTGAAKAIYRLRKNGLFGANFFPS